MTASEVRVVRVVSPAPARVLRVGVPGPPGPAGAAGGAAQTFTAGMPLPGHRAVVLRGSVAILADTGTPGHALGALGVTDHASETGQPVAVIRSGVMTEPSWTWVPDAPVYAGRAGALTQSPPASGWAQIIGVAQSATTLLVDPGVPITLTE